MQIFLMHDAFSTPPLNAALGLMKRICSEFYDSTIGPEQFRRIRKYIQLAELQIENSWQGSKFLVKLHIYVASLVRKIHERALVLGETWGRSLRQLGK